MGWVDTVLITDAKWFQRPMMYYDEPIDRYHSQPFSYHAETDSLALQSYLRTFGNHSKMKTVPTLMVHQTTRVKYLVKITCA